MKQKNIIISILVVFLIFGGVLISGCVSNNNTAAPNNSTINSTGNTSNATAVATVTNGTTKTTGKTSSDTPSSTTNSKTSTSASSSKNKESSDDSGSGYELTGQNYQANPTNPNGNGVSTTS